MKRHLASAFFLSFTFLVAVPAALAAPSKSARAEASLAAALQAVSPDPLGGQLGLVVASRIVAPKSGVASAALVRPAAPNSPAARAPRETVANTSPRS